MAGKSAVAVIPPQREKTFWQKVKEQKVLVLWALVFFVFGFIFYYLPLGG